MSKPDHLEDLRSQIRSIDQKILELASERMKLARQVGEYKKTHQLPVKDFHVEKLILDRAAGQAKKLGIYEELAQSLLKTLIRFSVVEQDEIKQNQPRQKKKEGKRFLIAGGRGNMGRWFSQFFDSLGYEVTIFDPNIKDQGSFPTIGNLERNLDHFDYIFLATPMVATNDILIKLSSQQKLDNSVIIEITSLKSPILEGLKLADQAGLRVVSMHPMFGPDTEILANRNIIFCEREKNQTDLEEVQKIFSLTSANIIRMPFHQHDQLMSYVLGAAHLINLVFASMLKDSGVALNLLETISGTTFARQLAVTQSVVFENQDLYFDIQNLNLETVQLYNNLEHNLAQFKDSILAQNRSKFKELMSATKVYFENC